MIAAISAASGERVARSASTGSVRAWTVTPSACATRSNSGSRVSSRWPFSMALTQDGDRSTREANVVRSSPRRMRQYLTRSPVRLLIGVPVTPSNAAVHPAYQRTHFVAAGPPAPS